MVCPSDVSIAASGASVAATTPTSGPKALEHLDVAIGEFRDMKMQPSL